MQGRKEIRKEGLREVGRSGVRKSFVQYVSIWGISPSVVKSGSRYTLNVTHFNRDLGEAVVCWGGGWCSIGDKNEPLHERGICPRHRLHLQHTPTTHTGLDK